MKTGYENKMRKPPNNKRAEAESKCHCIVCDPNFSTRGVTHFIDIHHVTPNGHWYIGDNVEQDASGKWRFKDPSAFK